MKLVSGFEFSLNRLWQVIWCIVLQQHSWSSLRYHWFIPTVFQSWFRLVLGNVGIIHNLCLRIQCWFENCRRRKRRFLEFVAWRALHSLIPFTVVPGRPNNHLITALVGCVAIIALMTFLVKPLIVIPWFQFKRNYQLWSLFLTPHLMFRLYWRSSLAFPTRPTIPFLLLFGLLPLFSWFSPRSPSASSPLLCTSPPSSSSPLSFSTTLKICSTYLTPSALMVTLKLHRQRICSLAIPWPSTVLVMVLTTNQFGCRVV